MARYKRKAELLKEYKRIAATADKRLQRLEKLSTQEHFKTVKKWAYARAVKDIERFRGEGKKRFGQNPPDNVKSIKAHIKAMKTFLNAPTSSKTRIINVYEKRAQTYKKNFGIELSWEDMAIFFERGYYNRMFKDYGSATAMKVLGVISQNTKKIKEAIEKSKTEQLVLTDDKVVQERVWEAVDSYKDELTEMGLDLS